MWKEIKQKKMETLKNIIYGTAKFILSNYIKTRLLFFKKNKILETPKTILYIQIKPLGLGDLLMNTPAMKEIRRKFPKAKISILTDRASLISGTKLVDEIIKYPVKKSEMKKLKEKFDLILMMNKALNQSLLAFKLKPKNVAGYLYDWKARATFTKKKINFTSQNHYYKMAYNVVELLGCKKSNLDLKKTVLDEIKFTKKDEKIVDKLLVQNKVTQNDKIISINPYVIGKTRRWGKQNIAELSNKLSKLKNTKVIIVGGPDEQKYINKIREITNKKIIFLNGKISLNQLAYLFKKSSLVITADAGPMHIAFSVGVKTLTLFGPTDPKTRIPLNELNKNFFYIWKNKECSKTPCYNLEYEPKCNICNPIRKITVDEVYKKSLEILKNN